MKRVVKIKISQLTGGMHTRASPWRADSERKFILATHNGANARIRRPERSEYCEPPASRMRDAAVEAPKRSTNSAPETCRATRRQPEQICIRPMQPTSRTVATRLCAQRGGTFGGKTARRRRDARRGVALHVRRLLSTRGTFRTTSLEFELYYVKKDQLSAVAIYLVWNYH